MRLVIAALFALLFSPYECQPRPRIRTAGYRVTDDEDNKDVNSTDYIVGGRTAEKGKYPWTVRLEVYYPGVSNSYGVCGASLWNKQWIVTAAHCFKDCNMNLMASEIKVCIGDYDQTIQDGEVCYWANNWRWHENYVYCDNRNSKNDIGLIKVENGMRVPYWGQNNEGNANFPWAPNNNWYDGTAQLTGWGAQNPNSNGNPNFPNRMKVVDLPLMSVAQCQRYWNVDNSQVCAGGVNGQNSCRGDSGGPLVWPSGGWSTLIGLSSYGPIVCASDGKPNVYTRVASFRGWIERYAGDIGTPA